ncbi:MAG TPA: DNA-directed RNA polymerase subunit omega [Firmicutes bacterium]|nr:DNA-directed RNA polymerase subunit omega [Bacillota bacterium]
MLNPPLSELMKHADSKYTLVIEAARRARQILGQKDTLANLKGRKAVSIALEEIAAGKVRYVRPKEGIK